MNFRMDSAVNTKISASPLEYTEGDNVLRRRIPLKSDFIVICMPPFYSFMFIWISYIIVGKDSKV